MTERAREVGLHWLKFNAVGAIGFVVQIAVFAALVRLAKINYLMATALAVETAVLHNFVWHERYTWRERTAAAGGGRWGRLVKFHLTNGALSIGGNLLVMRLLVGKLGMNKIAANVIAVAVCSLANFAASHWLVFGKDERAR